jgi:hypothetical protein
VQSKRTRGRCRRGGLINNHHIDAPAPEIACECKAGGTGANNEHVGPRREELAHGNASEVPGLPCLVTPYGH